MHALDIYMLSTCTFFASKIRRISALFVGEECRGNGIHYGIFAAAFARIMPVISGQAAQTR